MAGEGRGGGRRRRLPAGPGRGAGAARPALAVPAARGHGPSRLVDLGPPPDPFNHPGPSRPGLLRAALRHLTPRAPSTRPSRRLGHLVDLGVNAVEVMPVAAFRGSRGWGYDGVGAVRRPRRLRRARPSSAASSTPATRPGWPWSWTSSTTHLGPDGNYLGEFGPYFTDRSPPPGGRRSTWTGPGRTSVRGFVLDNAEQWRAPATASTGCASTPSRPSTTVASVHILEALAARAHAARPGSVVVAESDLRQPPAGHRLRDRRHLGRRPPPRPRRPHRRAPPAATRASNGLPSVAKALETGWVFTGQYYPYLDRRHGRDPAGWAGAVRGLPPEPRPGRQPGLRRAAGRPGRRPTWTPWPACWWPARRSRRCCSRAGSGARRRPFLLLHRPPTPGLAASVARRPPGRVRRLRLGRRGCPTRDPATFEAVQARLVPGRRAAAGARGRRLLRLRREVPALGNCRRDLAAARIDPRAAVGRPRAARPRRGLGRWSSPTWAEGSQHVPLDTGKLRLRVATRPCMPRRRPFWRERSGMDDLTGFDGALAGRGTTAPGRWGAIGGAAQWPERRSERLGLGRLERLDLQVVLGRAAPRPDPWFLPEHRPAERDPRDRHHARCRREIHVDTGAFSVLGADATEPAAS